MDGNFLACHVSNEKDQAEKEAYLYYLSEKAPMLPWNVSETIPAAVIIHQKPGNTSGPPNLQSSSHFV
jgi:hypothetical protein